MYIAVYSGNDNGALCHTFDLFEIIFQVGDCLLHHFGGLQYEGQNQLARAELIADLFHGGEEDVVERVNRRFVLRREITAVDDLIDIRFDSFLMPVQDLPVQALLGSHVLCRIGCASLLGRCDFFIKFDVSLQCVRTAVEDQVFGQILFFLGDIRVGGDMRGIDDRHIHASLNTVIEHDRVQHGSGVRREPKGQVAHSKRSHDARQVLLDEADAFDGLDRGIDEFFVAGGKRKGQRVVNQILRFKPVVIDCDIVNAPGNLELFLTRLCHAAFIDRQHDDSRVMLLGQFEHLVGLFASGFKMGGIDHTASRCSLECELKYVKLSRIDHKRHIHTHFKFLDDITHQLHFVRTLRDRTGNVEGMCAKFHLLTGDLQDRIVIL